METTTLKRVTKTASILFTSYTFIIVLLTLIF